MIVLSVQNVQKAFGVNEVLRGASLTLQDGRRLGLVGTNGSGKSTLLKILAGLDRADAGQITLARGTNIGYLAQQGGVAPGESVWQALEAVFEPVKEMEARLRALEGEMAEQASDAAAFERLSRQYASLTDQFEEADGYAWRSAIQGVLAGLGFVRAQWDQPAELLSGGERTRLCLARLLLQKPDLLLLDEPTNHLDLGALQWLESYLQAYKGAIILVTHDRYFLDAVCTDVAELIFGRIEQYEGNYTRYLRLRGERFETRQRAFDQQQKEIARQEAIIRQLRSFNREKQIKRARSREKVLEKMERLDRPQEEGAIRFRFEARRRTGEDVLIVRELEKGFEGRTLFEGLSMHLRAGDRVALIGPNGVGKSTLLKILMRQLAPDKGTIRFGANVDMGYYDQHQAGLHDEKTVLDELWDDFPHMQQTDLRSILGCFLFSGDDVFQPISTLSGGERGRVALTRLMLKRDNFLLLDEPTNHLDMDSREVLEQALEDFSGTLLTVSHDRYFINRLANRVIEMRADGVSFYLGNYDDYLEKKRMERFAPANDAAQGRTRTALEKEKRRDRLAREAERAAKARVEALEAEIIRQEEQVAAQELAMADPALYTDAERAQRAAKELSTTRADLERLYAEWEAMAEE